MKYIRLFESFSDITEDINLILVNLSDSTSSLVTNGVKGVKPDTFTNTLLVYNLDIKSKEFDKEEARTANLRLKDIGYQILTISRDYDNSTWYALVIKTDLYDILQDNDIIFWKDLNWENWHMNKSMGVNTKHCKLKLSPSTRDYDISIIDGSTGVSKVIEFNVSFADLEIDEEYRFIDRCTAEMYLIWLQAEYFGMTSVFNLIK